MPRRTAIAALVLAASTLPAVAESNLRLPSTGLDAGYDGKSFLVGGKRLFLSSAAVHYFRIVPEEWRDRLLMTRLAGFNTIETPVPWNLHEPNPALVHFDGPSDLGAFLDLCHELKLHAFVRIGPYVNAAVTNGGLPAWLGADPRLLVRSSNDKFIEAVRRYWARLLPIIAQRQAPRGPVILVQIEDHYTGPDDRYLARLLAEAKDRGIRVPVVLSDLNPCKDFQSFHIPDTQVFLSTELMPGGPLAWGERRQEMKGFGDILVEGIAKGIDGCNQAMWAAGTNFALLPANSFATRFEDGSCGLREGGAPSSIYAETREANWLAEAFGPVLTQASALEQHPLLDQGRRAGVIAYGRSDGTTALLFFKRRQGEGRLALTDSATNQAAEMPLAASAFRHVVANYPLTRTTALAFSTAQILTIRDVGGTRFFVVRVAPGAEPVMAFRMAKKPTIRAGDAAFTWDDRSKLLVLKWRCMERAARQDFAFEADLPVHGGLPQAPGPKAGPSASGPLRVAVVGLEESQAPSVWALDGAGLLVGAGRVGDWTAGDKPSVELRLPARRTSQAITFYPDGPSRTIAKLKGASEAKYDEAARRIDFQIDLDIMEPIPVFLRKWDLAYAHAEAAPDFDDSAWRESLRGTPMGEETHGWYRCRFRTAKAGQQKLLFENIADCVTVFLNGDYVGQSATKRLMDGPRGFAHPANFQLNVKAGDNVLAVFVKNWGCYRNTNSYGVPLGSATAWGILGNVLLDDKPLARWRQQGGLSPAGRSLTWSPVKKAETFVKDTTIHPPIRWYRAHLKLRPHPARPSLRLGLKGLSYGAIWLNGHFAGLINQQGADAGLGYYLPTAWLRDDNEVIVLEEGGREPSEAELRHDQPNTYVPLRIQFE